MGDVIQFPSGNKTNENKDNQFNVLVYKWWMDEFYPLFAHQQKLQRSYLVFGELLVSMRELREMDFISIHYTDDHMQLEMPDQVAELIYETVYNALESCSSDGEINSPDETVH